MITQMRRQRVKDLLSDPLRKDRMGNFDREPGRWLLREGCEVGRDEVAANVGGPASERVSPRTNRRSDEVVGGRLDVGDHPLAAGDRFEHSGNVVRQVCGEVPVVELVLNER